MPPKRRVPKGPAPSGLTSVASFFAACSQAEALGAAAQQALQVQGGGRCRASELRKKRVCAARGRAGGGSRRRAHGRGGRESGTGRTRDGGRSIGI